MAIQEATIIPNTPKVMPIASTFLLLIKFFINFYFLNFNLITFLLFLRALCTHTIYKCVVPPAILLAAFCIIYMYQIMVFQQLRVVFSEKAGIFDANQRPWCK